MTKSDKPPDAAPELHRSPRLREVAKQLPQNPVTPTSGAGFRQWETKRLKAFLVASAALQRGTGRITDLRLAAGELSEYIAARMPAALTALPRGYSITVNAGGERALACHGVLLGPWYSEPEPDEAVLRQVGADLKTGLLVEIEGTSGAKLK